MDKSSALGRIMAVAVSAEFGQEQPDCHGAKLGSRCRSQGAKLSPDIKVGHLDMSIPDLIANVRSGVVHIEFHMWGRRIASGTGFMARDFLITNHHVFLGPRDSTVVLAWQPTQDPLSRTEVQMNYASFAGCLVTGSDQKNYDFAVLKIPAMNQLGLYEQSHR